MACYFGSVIPEIKSYFQDFMLIDGFKIDLNVATSLLDEDFGFKIWCLISHNQILQVNWT